MTATRMTRFEIFKRDKFTCQYCGRRPPAVMLELEHVRPVSAGGTADAWNLVTACHDCNQGKLARPLSLEQIHRIDGHVPNLIAQFLAMQMEYPTLNVAQRLFDISVRGRVFGEWLVDLDALFDKISAECWALDGIPDGGE